MKILALELSSQLRSVAIAQFENQKFDLLSSVQDADFRGVTGMMLIDRSLAQASLQSADITHIAVGIGPGSYSGIRAAIAIAKGWQLGRNVQIAAISSVDCLAEQAHEAGVRGPASIVVDAQRGEIYLARFNIFDAELASVTSLAILKPQAVNTAETIIGPEATRFFPTAPSVQILSPSAAVLARLAVDSNVFIPGEQLEPIYLRAASFVKAPPSRHI